MLFTFSCRQFCLELNDLAVKLQVFQLQCHCIPGTNQYLICKNFRSTVCEMECNANISFNINYGFANWYKLILIIDLLIGALW